MNIVSTLRPRRRIVAAASAAVLTLAVTACGSDDKGSDTSGDKAAAAGITLVKSGKLKYLSANPTISKVKLFADSAVATGVATVTALRDGTETTIHISWSAVLAWRGGRWLLTTWTSTLIDPQAK